MVIGARGAAFARVKGPEGVTQDLQPKVVNKDVFMLTMGLGSGLGYQVSLAGTRRPRLVTVRTLCITPSVGK